MSQIFNIILTIIAPIILVAGLGFVLDRTKTIDPRSISRVVIYLASPSLAFYGMVNASLKGDELVSLFIIPLLLALIMAFLAWMVTVFFKMNRLTASAFVLSVAMVNMGNYGIPFNEFAFGQPGLERALVMVVAQVLSAHTIGVFLASWGKVSILQASKNVLKVPAPYAVILGLVINFGQLNVPDLVMRVVGILQGSAVPLMLLLLGVQISRVSFKGRQWGITFGAAGMRLVGGAIVGALIATALGLQGVTNQVAIIESAMPTAVVSTLLATEFESDAKLVSSVVLVSTMLSVITLSVLLYILW